MIMRDSAKVLPRCLENLKQLVDEIIIVDTGSKDSSVQIARSYGAQVYFDPWQDDFARPRNIGLTKATREWILIMDPDEVILPKDHIKIRWLTRSERFVAFWITTRNYGHTSTDLNFRSMVKEADPLKMYEGFVPSTKTRFFKNGLGIEFKGCWHELVDWYLLKNRLPTGSSDVVVHHWAHEIAQKDAEEKKRFSLKMGEKKVREWPENGQCWWELAVAEAIIGYRARALHSFAQAFKLGFAKQDQYFVTARLLKMLGDEERSQLAFQKGVCSIFPMLTHIDPVQRPITALIDGL